MDILEYQASLGEDLFDLTPQFLPRLSPRERRTTVRLNDYRYADIVRMQGPNMVGTSTRLMLSAHRPGTIFGFTLVTQKGSVAKSDTNYWVVKLYRVRAGVSQVIGVKDTSNTAGEAITELVPWNMGDQFMVKDFADFSDTTNYFTDNKVLQQDDVVLVKLTKVGDPNPLYAPLLQLFFGQEYQGDKRAVSSLTDPFTLSVLNDAWVGTTWTVFNLQIKNIPLVGADLVTNGDFELWDSASDAQNWTEATAGGTSAVARDGTTQHGGTYGAKITVDATPHAAGYYQAEVNPIYAWVRHTVYARLVTSTPTIKLSADGAAGLYAAFTPGAAYSQFTWTERASSANLNRGIVAAVASTVVATDDFASKILSLPSLFNLALMDSYNKTIQVDLTAPNTTVQAQGGLALNVDDPANPRNFVIVYYNHQDEKIYVDKCVNGEYSNVRATATTYVAGAVLQVVKSGTSYTVYYGGTIVGAADAITDVTVIYNPWHGLFSTNPSIMFDNFSAV